MKVPPQDLSQNPLIQEANFLLATTGNGYRYFVQFAKIDLNKKWLLKQKTIQNFNIDVQGFRKTRNENLPSWEIGVIS